MDTGREAFLEAFDRLFAKTAGKLRVEYTADDMADAKEAFAERMEKLLEVMSTLPPDALPASALAVMEQGVDDLSPAQVVGQVAALPLIQHSQTVLQRLAHRAVEQKFIESALEQADTTYGGN